MKLSMLAALMVLLFPVRPAAAQPLAGEIPRDPMLVHLDTPTILGRSTFTGRLDIRAFGGDEDIIYTSLALHYGLGNGWEALARGTFAETKELALPGGTGGGLENHVTRQAGSAIKHGGNDFELAAKYAPPNVRHIAGIIGVSISGTPAQNDSFFTAGGMAAANWGDRLTGYLNPRAVFIDSNTILGIGIGARVRVTDQLFVVGDYTPIVSGDNTRDTTTGDRKRRDVYGVAVRIRPGPASGVEIDLGYGNGVGTTTGFGLTPGLGGSGAFYFSLTARR